MTLEPASLVHNVHVTFEESELLAQVIGFAIAQDPQHTTFSVDETNGLEILRRAFYFAPDQGE